MVNKSSVASYDSVVGELQEIYFEQEFTIDGSLDVNNGKWEPGRVWAYYK